MVFGKVAAAALVFGILYAIMFSYMCVMYATKRYKWKSRFTILFLHAAIRVASQACGVAFGVLLWKNTEVFVAYLILGAEGYFSLTIASYYFLRHYELRNFGKSRLGQLNPAVGTWKRAAQIWTWMPLWAPWRYTRDNVIMIVDAWLIPANALIITGGSLMVAAMNPEANHLTAKQAADRLNLAKGFRTAGQAVFLTLTCVWVLFVLNALRKTVAARLSRRKHIACAVFGTIGVFLIIRGVFGVLQSVIWKLSYYNPSNYDAQGFTTEFVALENVLAVMPEFVAAALLNASYWATHKHADEVLPFENGSNEPDGHQETKGLNV
ncbi:uncharacterized protein CcaverHIS019_0103420 [Cutaneotrichosporon cavernicola]|uniref:Uncharacterized protein n=1 Tax=Cutaneotrichosporon cavernicola TaxID=279322 RepID=A0AA48HY26_9TREE|nr:uncharacterized protein CcaverHIS019_0103420 [Cutaneotrichosporon cavernicola]BEI87624.1 hypothetical protein CcaverHIS019_0103420 [Cutaneotrichosporon cavernicola]